MTSPEDVQSCDSDKAKPYHQSNPSKANVQESVPANSATQAGGAAQSEVGDQRRWPLISAVLAWFYQQLLLLGLWFLSWKIRRGLSESTQMAALTQGKQVLILIGFTGASHRSFHFDQNGFQSAMIAAGQLQTVLTSSTDASPVSVSFADGLTAIEILKQQSINALMTGIQEKKIKVAGEYGSLMWFISLCRHLQPVKKPSKQ